MDRIVELREYKDAFHKTIGKEDYVRLRDRAGDALVVRDLFKALGQDTCQQLDSLLDPSGIPAAIDDLSNKTLGPDQCRMIQGQIKYDGDGTRLQNAPKDRNQAAYQQYISLVNGNQEAVEKFLREKLTSDTFDKLWSALKKTADNVRMGNRPFITVFTNPIASFVELAENIQHPVHKCASICPTWSCY
ncbi:MAG: hypothetical protein J3Q66DRAFT_393058 [Benniella sp.]|nr:MAG: hypothetical protein J3Q66DRAFT_393058 [Benniella sp.]